MTEVEKVCVRIPANRKAELLQIAKLWRGLDEQSDFPPGWDAQAIHQIARERFGGLEPMFKHHGWEERGSDMMRYVQRRVKETYGSVHAFVAQNSK
ncbi:hypothetical protein ABWI00_10025 [Algihabitans albus]|uniref:hypothetical protein n=1 Tax=Algihabitans albus TaxID=2164067 RepID=UPI0035CF0966